MTWQVPQATMGIGISRAINKILEPMGISLHKKIKDHEKFPVEATPCEKEIMRLVLGDSDLNRLTMVSPDRLWSAICSVKYIVENNIDGDIVECGVWRGGCSIAMALVLKQLKSSKKVFLFDTFAGMTAPTGVDKNAETSVAAKHKYLTSMREDHNEWCYASIEDVKQNFIRHDCIHNAVFVKGDVIDTLQDARNLPSAISLLRLDTDWYESTKKELEVLFPLLQSRGVLLIDDYGHWEGSRKAVDEYFSSSGRLRPLFWKTDYTGRGALKIS